LTSSSSASTCTSAVAGTATTDAANRATPPIAQLARQLSFGPHRVAAIRDGEDVVQGPRLHDARHQSHRPTPHQGLHSRQVRWTRPRYAHSQPQPLTPSRSCSRACRGDSRLSVSDMLFDERDLERCFSKVEAIDFHQTVELEGIKFYCHHAGHVLGGSMFNIEIAGVKVRPMSTAIEQNGRARPLTHRLAQLRYKAPTDLLHRRLLARGGPAPAGCGDSTVPAGRAHLRIDLRHAAAPAAAGPRVPLYTYERLRRRKHVQTGAVVNEP